MGCAHPPKPISLAWHKSNYHHLNFSSCSSLQVFIKVYEPIWNSPPSKWLHIFKQACFMLSSVSSRFINAGRRAEQCLVRDSNTHIHLFFLEDTRAFSSHLSLNTGPQSLHVCEDNSPAVYLSAALRASVLILLWQLASETCMWKTLPFSTPSPMLYSLISDSVHSHKWHPVGSALEVAGKS